MLIEDLYDVYYYVDGNHIGSSGQNTEEVYVIVLLQPFTSKSRSIPNFVMFNDLNKDCVLSINESVELVNQAQG